MKTLNNQSNRKPINLLTHHNNMSLNDNFLYRIQKQRGSIIKILNDKNSTKELENSIFIFEMNEFNNDLLKIVLLLDQDYDIYLKKQDEDFFKQIASEELLSKLRKFYWVARNYENFTKHPMNPEGNFGYHISPDTFLQETKPYYCKKETNYNNIQNAYLFFKDYDDYFKNFINTLYEDDEEGEKFVQKKFNEITKEYKYLKEMNDSIKKQLSIYPIKKEKHDACIQKIETIMKKYPATIHKAIINLLNFSEKNQNI